jgi:hypothetical protein
MTQVNIHRFPILVHLDRLSKLMEVLDDHCVLAIGILCCERQFVELRRVLAFDRTRTCVNICELLLCRLWANVSESFDALDSDTISKCQTMLTDNGETNDELMIGVLGSFETLTLDYTSSYLSRTSRVAEIGLNLIESMLYEALQLDVNDSTRAAICNHELMQREMLQQLADADRLRACPSHDYSSLIVALRRESRGVGIFGNPSSKRPVQK